MRFITLCLVLFLLASCAAVSVSPKELTPVTNLKFYLKDVYAAGSYNIRNGFGSISASPYYLCAGEYRSVYRDEDGVYYAVVNNCMGEVCRDHKVTTPENICMSNGRGGIWVPDNPATNGFEIWLPVSRSPQTERNGLSIDMLDAAEAGNLKRLGWTIESDKVKSEILQTTQTM